MSASGFNRRADQLKASQNNEKNLKSRILELAQELAARQSIIDEYQDEPTETCDLDELNAQLKDARFCAKKSLDILTEMRGRGARDAFCTSPEKATLYNKLLCIAQTCEFEFRCEIAYLELQIYKCCYEDQQAEKEAAIEWVEEFLDCNEVDDKQCNYYIGQVMSGL